MNKLKLAKLLDWTHALDALLVLRRMVAVPWLQVLTYHRIARPETVSGLLSETIDAPPEQLDRQIEFLAQHFQFIGMSDLLAFHRGAPLPPNPVLLTFDDGYLECYTEALPILRRHGAKATFFVATSYTEERRLFWWDAAGILLDRADRDFIELDYPFSVRLSIDDKKSALRALTGIVKTYAGLDLRRFLDGLAEACGVYLDRREERALADTLLMTWDQVRALERAGMDVESHTRTHRVMNTLSRQEICEELVGSRADLEAQLGRRVTALAYPVGYRLRHMPHVRDALREAGYELAFTNQTGVNHTLLRGDRYDLNRISMSRGYEDVFFRAMMAVPYLAPSRQALQQRQFMPTQRAPGAGARPTRAPPGRATDAMPIPTQTLHT